MRQLVPNLQIAESIKLEKLRELPIAGEVLVKEGDVVNAEDIIAKSELPGDLQVLKIPERTGIAVESVIPNLQIKQGDLIEKGQIIFSFKGIFGLFTTEVKAPLAGVVEFISEKTGHVGIRAASKPIELNAYISGKVTEVHKDKSVKIETQASFLQGIFGVGGERFGLLHLLDFDLSKELDVENLPDNAEGKVLIGGTSPTIKFLEEAAVKNISGLVVGSIDDQTLKTFLGYDLGIALTGDEDLPFTLIITEGFGKLAISERVINWAKSVNNQPVSINGATQVRAGAVRPELIVSNTNLTESAEDIKTLDVGSRIRIIRYPYFGQVAEVTEMPSDLVEVGTGAKTRVLRAKLNNDEVVTVPRANIELV